MRVPQINCFLSSGREGNDFALGGTEGDKGGASGSSTHSAIDDNENVAHTGKSIGFLYQRSWRRRSHRCGQADAAGKSEHTSEGGCACGLGDSEGLASDM